MSDALFSDSTGNLVEYSVSEISGSIKRTVEDAFGHVRVRGEISGYRGPHSSGHAYFTLKDERARIEAVIWRATFSKLKFKPEEGMEMIATGKITTYPGSSKYQIVIEALEPAGAGALMALLEERRRKLAAEGLFEEARKAAVALHAARHRRRHLADGGGDPRHPPQDHGPLSGSRPRLARARPGRDLRAGGRRRRSKGSTLSRQAGRSPARTSSSLPAGAAASKISGGSTTKPS